MRTELVPLWLDWHGRCVLVVGLGSVGQRRALTFQRAGAVTIGFDPMPAARRPEWGELIRGGLELHAEPYESSIFDELKTSGCGPDLVLACATREVNRRVIEDALARRIWVVSATIDNEGDSIQATAHMGAETAGDQVRIAVRTGNAAPSLAVSLRDRIAGLWLAPADSIAVEMAKWRGLIVGKKSLSAEERKRILSHAGDPDLLDLETEATGSGVEELRKRLAAGLGIETPSIIPATKAIPATNDPARTSAPDRS